MESLYLCLLKTIETKDNKYINIMKSCFNKINIILDYENTNKNDNNFDNIFMNKLIFCKRDYW